jgi:hypothetical protein
MFNQNGLKNKNCKITKIYKQLVNLETVDVRTILQVFRVFELQNNCQHYSTAKKNKFSTFHKQRVVYGNIQSLLQTITEN